MSKRSKSSHRWLARQRRDPYSGRAASRAYFKLQALDERFRLTGPSRVALELGAAPGGWTEYLAPRCRRVVACDLRLMTVPNGVDFIQGDVREPAVVERLRATLGSDGVDLVLSDMAPNMSGNKVTDQALSLELVECAVRTGAQWLKPGGRLVVKLFQGVGFETTVSDMRARFAKVTLAKPPASRDGSRELYAIADVE